MEEIDEFAEFADFDEDAFNAFEEQVGEGVKEGEKGGEKEGENDNEDSQVEAEQQDDLVVTKKEKKSKKDKKDKKEKKKKRVKIDEGGEHGKRRKLLEDEDSLVVPKDEPVSALAYSEIAEVKSEIATEHVDATLHAKEKYISPALQEGPTIQDWEEEKMQLQKQLTSLTTALRALGKAKRQELDEDAFREWKATWHREHNLSTLKSKISNLENLIAERKERVAGQRDLTVEIEEGLEAGDRFKLLVKKLAPLRSNAQKFGKETATEKARLLLGKMKQARWDDLELIKKKSAATAKLQILTEVEATCRNAGYQQALVKEGLLQNLEGWLRAPTGQLPSYQIRSTVMRVLLDLPYEGDPGRVRAKYETDWVGVSKEDLTKTALGMHVNKFAEHPSETQENRKLATSLIEKWSRIIFGLSKNYKQLAVLEKETGRASTFKAEDYVLAADVVKYTKDGQKYIADRNTDGEPAATRCRLPKTMMPDFTRRPEFVVVTGKIKSQAHRAMERNLRATRGTSDRAMKMSIEGSASTLQAE